MKRAFWGCVALGLALGTLYVFVTPAGAPYDEPSHFGTVQYYADHGRLPELGEPGVSYQAQQPPLYYAGGAVIYRVGRAIDGEHAGFYLLRFCTLLLIVPMALLTRKLAMLLWAADQWLASAAGAFVALAAPILTMSSSIQNDSLVIVLALWAITVFIDSERHRSLVRAVGAGVLLGLAVLAKTSALPIAAGCLLVVVVRHESGWLRRAGALVATTGLISGGWFVRNLVLYRDPTGHSAIPLTGYPNLAAAPLTPTNLAKLGWTFIAYYWTPTEYYRNVFTAPVALRILVALLCAVGAAGIAVAVRRRERPEAVALLTISATGAVTMLMYLVVYFGNDPIAPRLTYILFATFAIAVCAGLRELDRRLVVAAVAALVAINLFFLQRLAAEPHRISQLW